MLSALPTFSTPAAAVNWRGGSKYLALAAKFVVAFVGCVILYQASFTKSPVQEFVGDTASSSDPTLRQFLLSRNVNKEKTAELNAYVRRLEASNSTRLNFLDEISISQEKQKEFLHVLEKTEDKRVIDLGRRLATSFVEVAKDNGTKEEMSGALRTHIPEIRSLRTEVFPRAWQAHHKVRLADDEFVDGMPLMEVYSRYLESYHHNRMLSQAFEFIQHLAEGYHLEHVMDGLDSEKVFKLYLLIKQLVEAKGMHRLSFSTFEVPLEQLANCALYVSNQQTLPAEVVHCATVFAHSAIDQMRAESY